jgi:hypothetical protein
MADEIDYNPAPVDPAVDPEVGNLPSEVESGFYDNTPIPVDPTVDPYANPIESGFPPLSEIDQGPAATDAAAGIQRFDDGSFIQTFDDGSVITGDATGNVKSTPAPSENPYNQFNTGTFTGPLFNTNSDSATITEALRVLARQQQSISSQRKQINNADWRVRLRLAPQSTYLYNAPNPGPLLQPLQVTDGVIFPYTPQISTAYKANYSTYDLTHSNYRGYFYQNSYVDVITINAMFTAQSTSEANYLLGVITFFKAVTKMFYGQDAQRGSPPPLTYLSGLGQYQFNEHPCLVQSFNYSLPNDVDYIRAGSGLNVGIDLSNQRSKQTVSTNSLFGSLNRLASVFLNKGALPNVPSPPILGQNTNATYVPTKLEIQLTLLPVQSRNQVSKQFSVKEFANGNLIKGGFW